MDYLRGKCDCLLAEPIQEAKPLEELYKLALLS